MKATIAFLTALLVSTITTSAARAQQPIQPVGHGGSVAKGGGADGNCGGDCADAPRAKRSLFGKKGDSCGKHGGGSSGCGHKCKLCDWFCRPLPSDAPSCRKPEYPLGFPNHPYLRSPRDYFMMD